MHISNTIAHNLGKEYYANAESLVAWLPLLGSVIVSGDSRVAGDYSQSSPVNSRQIAEWTAKDTVLSKVKK